MNGITKNLLLVLTFVCAIALVVFCIQLIVINRGVDPLDPGSGITGGSGQEGEGEPGAGDPDSGEEQGGVPSTDPPPRPIPQGTPRMLHVSAENNLLVYARDELFDFEEGEIDWWFKYTGGGTATLEIGHLMLLAQNIETIAESFLNNYTGSDDSVFTGEELIHGSPIWGYHVHAHHGIGRYEAWIHRLIGTDIALVFVIYYENDTQRDALYEVLSTIEFIRVGDPGPIPPPDVDLDPPPGDSDSEED
jgi:hypothetical protein